MHYTFCKNCDNEFDIDDIEIENECPHCGRDYDILVNDDSDMVEGVDEEVEHATMGEFLSDDGEWKD